jgi:hypothetical protein
VEEEEQPERDERHPARDAQVAPVVPEQAEPAERASERDADEQERSGQAERVRGQEHDPPRDRARCARQREHGAEHGADARRGAHGEGSSQERVRAVPRAREEPRRDHPLRPRQQPGEREPEDHEQQARELDPPLRCEHGAERGRARPEDDEHEREAEHERDAPREDPPRRRRAARDDGDVAGDER